MSRLIAILNLILFALSAVPARAQKPARYYAEGYGFWGRRNSTPGQSVTGGGGELFPFRGIALGGDVGTTIGNPDDKITIGSVGGSYHFFCCQAKRKFEPFGGAGYSFLWGNINTHGRDFPFDPGNNRTGPYLNQGLIIWPYKRIGARIEVREYLMFVSYGGLEDVIPGGKVVEFRLGVTFR